MGAARAPARGSLKVARLSPRRPGPGIRVHAARRDTMALGHLPGCPWPCRCHRGAVGPRPLPSRRPGALATYPQEARGRRARSRGRCRCSASCSARPRPPVARVPGAAGFGVGGCPSDRGRSGALQARVTGRGRAGAGADWAPERRAGARPGTGPGPGTVSRAPQRGLSPWLRAAGPRASPRAAVTARRAPGPPRPAPPPPRPAPPPPARRSPRAPRSRSPP